MHEGYAFLYYNQTNGVNTFKCVKVTEENVYILERYYRRSKSIFGLKRMVVQINILSSKAYETHSCAAYSLQSGRRGSNTFPWKLQIEQQTIYSDLA